MNIPPPLRLVAAVVVVVATAAAEPLPPSYSLAARGRVPPVKDQGVLGTCWAFSSTTTFEAALIRLGVLTPTTAANYLSEWDLATHNGIRQDVVAPYNDWGGSPPDAIAAYTRGFGVWKRRDLPNRIGGGPVLTAITPQNVYPLAAANKGENLTPYLTPAGQPLAPYRLGQAIEFVDPQQVAGKPMSAAFRATLKRAILRYGALDTNINATGLGPPNDTMNPATDTFAYVGNSAQTTHDVTVVGWDDTIPVTDKQGTLLGTGAWLIQNSWGDKWGKSDFGGKPPGYFWLGYADTVGLKYCATYIPVKRGGVSPNVLQNQLFSGSLAVGDTRRGDSVWTATRWIASSDAPLVALGLWTTGPRQVVDVAIYRDGDGDGPRDQPVAAKARVLFPEQGYAEIPLARPLRLTAGSPLYVVVRFRPGGSERPVALDTTTLQAVADWKGPRGLSWISRDGETWRDLGEAGNERPRGVFFLKGLVGGGRIPAAAAVVQVSHVRRPLRTWPGRSVTIRGLASFNATEVLYQLDRQRVRRTAGVQRWRVDVRRLHPGPNVLRVWATTATGVAATPLRLVIQRRLRR